MSNTFLLYIISLLLFITPKAICQNEPISSLTFNNIYEYSETNTFLFTIPSSETTLTSFYIHLTTAAGNANIANIYTSETENTSAKYSSSFFEKKLILDITNESNVYRFTVDCTSCHYFLQLRTINDEPPILLSRSITNYEFIPLTSFDQNYQIADSTSTNFKYQMMIYSPNCQFVLHFLGSFDQFYGPLIYYENDISSNKNFKLTELSLLSSTSKDKQCYFYIDISDLHNSNIAFTIPQDMPHSLISNNTNLPIKFNYYKVNTNTKTKIYIDNHQQGSYKLECEDDTTHYGNLKSVYTMSISNVGKHYCVITPLSEKSVSQTHFNYTITVREDEQYPLYFEANRLEREHLSFGQSKVYYTEITSLNYNFVFHRNNYHSNVCIRIKQRNSVDKDATWMNTININSICESDMQVAFDSNNDIAVPFNNIKDIKCSISTPCLVLIKITNPIEVQTQSTNDNDNDYYDDISFYIQDQTNDVDVSIGEQIHGSFYNIPVQTLSYKVNITLPTPINLLINFERTEDNIALTVQTFKPQTSELLHEYSLTKPTESFIKIDGADISSLRLIVKANNKDQHKSQFKISINPQYPLSPVQTPFLHVGESNICDISIDNQYCVFMLFVQESEASHGFSFYVNIPFDSELKPESIYVKSLPYYNIIPFMFLYKDWEIVDKFPTEHSAFTNVIKDNDVYYYKDDTFSEMKMVFIRVNVLRPATVKLYTERYHKYNTNVKAYYAFEKRFYYIPSDKQMKIEFNVKEGNAVAIQLLNGTTINDIEHVEYSEITNNNTLLVFKGESSSSSSTKAVTFNVNDSNNARSFYIETYKQLGAQPLFRNFNEINELVFSSNDSNEGTTRSLFIVLPRSKNINMNILFTSINKTDINFCKDINIRSSVVNSDIYLQKMRDPSSSITSTTSQPTCHDDIALLHMSSSYTEINYLYLEITLNTQPSPNSAVILSLISQEQNVPNDYIIKLDKSLYGKITQSKESTNTSAIMIYNVETTLKDKYVLEVELDIKTDKVTYDLTEYPWDNTKQHLPWYIESIDGSIKLIISENHPHVFAFKLTFPLGQDETFNYEVKLYLYKPVNKILYLSLGIVAFFVVIIILMLIKFKVSKRMKVMSSDIDDNYLIDNAFGGDNAPIQRDDDAPQGVQMDYRESITDSSDM